MSPLESLHANFTQALKLPKDAVDWLCGLYSVIQVFDDVADGDKVTRSDLDDAIWVSLVSLPTNAFYVKHASDLAPCIKSAIMKWKASDTAERSGKAGAMAYAWRASYYDIVLMCLCLVHGRSVAMQSAHIVMGLYGEPIEKYMKEFNCA